MADETPPGDSAPILSTQAPTPELLEQFTNSSSPEMRAVKMFAPPRGEFEESIRAAERSDPEAIREMNIQMAINDPGPALGMPETRQVDLFSLGGGEPVTLSSDAEFAKALTQGNPFTNTPVREPVKLHQDSLDDYKPSLRPIIAQADDPTPSR